MTIFYRLSIFTTWILLYLQEHRQDPLQNLKNDDPLYCLKNTSLKQIQNSLALPPPSST